LSADLCEVVPKVPQWSGTYEFLGEDDVGEAKHVHGDDFEDPYEPEGEDVLDGGFVSILRQETKSLQEA
jgi:hypothetical protein